MVNNIVYILLLVGGVLVFYANSNENKYLLVLGIVILMFGLFKLNQKLTSNKKKTGLEVKTERDNN